MNQGRGQNIRGVIGAMDEFDVLVIGLGPAGAAAATAAAKAGVSVLAVERHSSEGGSATCPEFIPLPVGSYAHADRVVIQNIAGLRGHLNDGTDRDNQLPGCVIDRAAFDRALIEFSRTAGANLFFKSTLAGLDADHSEATLNLAGDMRRIHYRALVASDGHQSDVARLLGLPALRKMFIRRYRVPLYLPQQTVDVWLSPRYPGGYGWLVPAGKDALIGTGMEEHNAQEALDALHRQLAEAGVVGSDILTRYAGFVPVEGLRARLAVGNILFTGDAAGMAHPITGAGVYPAVVSGEAAGRAAAEWSAGHLGAIPAYEATMRGQFGEVLARAVMRRQPLEFPLDAGLGAAASMEGGWSAIRGAFE